MDGVWFIDRPALPVELLGNTNVFPALRPGGARSVAAGGRRRPPDRSNHQAAATSPQGITAVASATLSMIASWLKVASSD